MDLGCGDGTTAVPLARLGADVIGIDIARNLVEAGNKRAAEAGLTRLKFQEGDACNLEGVGDHSFDLTLSVFGAMFAPKPFDVAKEMVRVTKPGGRIVMGNWIPNDPTFVSQLLKISSAFTPPPPEGFVSPDDLGRGYSHRRAFWPGRSAQGENLHGQGHVPLHVARQKPGAIHRPVSKRFYGPTMNAFEAAEKNGKAEELHSQLVELAKAQNQKQRTAALRSPPPSCE